MVTPCSRCTRLSVECVPTPPSRRGRAGERKVKRKRQAIGVQTEDFQGISKMAKYELMIVDTCADGLEPAKEGE
jgi:ribosomal protein L44E